MLGPLSFLYQGPVDPQVGSALVLLYPAAIAYATVRYRLFDATVVIRRSVIYTGLAGLITGAYALLLAGTNALLAQADLTRSPWFSAAFMFVVVLLFNPLRERVRRAVDRTLCERYDYAQAMRTLARSMSSLLDLDEITRRLTTTIESGMHVRADAPARRRLSPRRPGRALFVPGALSRYQLAADPRFGGDGGAALGAYQALGAEVVVPLRFQARLRALLVLGASGRRRPIPARTSRCWRRWPTRWRWRWPTRRRTARCWTTPSSSSAACSSAAASPSSCRAGCASSSRNRRRRRRSRAGDRRQRALRRHQRGTRLSSRLPPGDLAGLVERYFGAFLDEIVAHGGDVNETAGDGAHGDLPRGPGRPRGGAAHAARGIQPPADEINGERAPSTSPSASTWA